MKIIPLWKAIAETGAKGVFVNNSYFTVDSPEYEEKKDWLIKGHFTQKQSMMKACRVIVCAKLEKDLTITVNPYTIKADEAKEELEKDITILVFHKETLISAGKEIQVKHISAFAEVCFKSFEQNYPDLSRDPLDFAVAIIDWEARNIKLEKL